MAAGAPIQTIQQSRLQINGLQLSRAAYALQMRAKPQVQLGQQACVIHRWPQLRLQLMQKGQPAAQLQLRWRPTKPRQTAALQLLQQHGLHSLCIRLGLGGITQQQRTQAALPAGHHLLALVIPLHNVVIEELFGLQQLQGRARQRCCQPDAGLTAVAIEMGRHQSFAGGQGILRLQRCAAARAQHHHTRALLSSRQRQAIGIGQGQHNPHPRSPAVRQQRNTFGQTQLTAELQRQLTDGCQRTRSAALLQQIKPQAKVGTNGVLAQGIPFA